MVRYGCFIVLALCSQRLLAIETEAVPASFSARIDELIEKRLKDANVNPAPVADDAEFLRRVYLDLTGVLPRVGEVREFLSDQRPDKRSRVIAELLVTPRHATHLAN